MRSIGLITALLVAAVCAYIYTHQAQSAAVGTSNPRAAADVTGVKNDLLAIAQAERTYNASHGNYLSIDDLRSESALTMLRANRGPYTYSSEVSSDGFQIIATYTGLDPAMQRSLSIDETMQIRQQFGNH